MFGFGLGIAILLVSGFANAQGVVMSTQAFTETPTLLVPNNVKALFGHPLPRPEQISSTFGPRWKWSEDRYDYHPGIDFYDDVNTTIVSIGDGEVYRIYPVGGSQFTNGGNTVAIRHNLPTPILFHGQNISVLYSLYLHLDHFATNLTEGDNVTRGQTVGFMGSTGTTNFVHLHFETRLGTICSLPYQVENNGTTSCSTYAFEPKVHPLAFLPAITPSGNGTTPLVPSMVTVTADAAKRTITYLVNSRQNLALNRILFGGVVLDFCLYTGFNATDLAVLDDFSKFSWGKLWPGAFLSSSMAYNMTVEFNDASMLNGPVTFVDLWGNGIIATVASNSSNATGTPAPLSNASTPTPNGSSTTAAPGTAVPSTPNPTPAPANGNQAGSSQALAEQSACPTSCVYFVVGLAIVIVLSLAVGLALFCVLRGRKPKPLRTTEV